MPRSGQRYGDGRPRQGTIACRPAVDRNPETTAISAQAYKTGAYLFLAAVLGTHAFFLWSVRSRIAKGDPDFTVFYTAGKIVRAGLGSKLYDPRTQQAVQQEFATNSDIRRGALPYIHPPFEALLFLPLTFLPYRVAFMVWNLVNLGLLFIVAWLMRGSLSTLRRVPAWALVLISLAFFPIFANFHQGQDAILLLLLLVLSFRALEADAMFAAGCWLGLGMFKYHLILPLVLILGVWRGKKLVAGFAAVASAAVVLSVGMVGWSGALQYPAYAGRVVSEPAFGGIPLRQLPNLLGLVAGWPLTEKAGWPVLLVVGVGTVALLIVVARTRDLANDTAMFRLSMSCAVIAALLAGFSTNSYDLSLLVLPLVLVADYCCREPRLQRAGLLAPAIPLLISPLWFFLWMRWERINLMAVFLVWWLFVIRTEIVRLRANIEKPPSERALA